jgi:hypothetical protein
MSVRASMCWRRSVSGATQGGVPTGRCCALSAAMAPKSISFTDPVAVTYTLRGDTSRCTQPRE